MHVVSDSFHRLPKKQTGLSMGAATSILSNDGHHAPGQSTEACTVFVGSLRIQTVGGMVGSVVNLSYFLEPSCRTKCGDSLDKAVVFTTWLGS